MKNLLKFTCVVVFTLVVNLLYAQFPDRLRRVAERAAERTVENRVDREVSKKTDEGMDAILKDKDKKKSKGKKSANKSLEEDNSNGKATQKKTSNLEEDEESITVNFKRGSVVLYQDNFSKDAVGDFPAKWNSTSGGEIKKLKGFDEKFLKVPANSVINLEMKKPLPANFTIEMDMLFPEASEIIMAGFGLGTSPQTIDYLLSSKDYLAVYFNSNGEHRGDWDEMYYGTSYNTTTIGLQKMRYVLPLNEKVHIGIMVNNHKRFRLYVNGKKMIDLPNSFNPQFAKSFFFNEVTTGNEKSKEGYFYVSNVLITETGTDERSLVQKELIEKGTFTTNDILFATNSDKIQASSFDILKQIGEAMESAPDMKFMIIGHTDSDGDDKANQLLSEKRAASVKNYLIGNFNVKGASLNTSGKGESDPVASNSTAEGKAQNRRVEFKKL